jgi:hypothetical protein
MCTAREWQVIDMVDLFSRQGQRRGILDYNRFRVWLRNRPAMNRILLTVMHCKRTGIKDFIL